MLKVNELIGFGSGSKLPISLPSTAYAIDAVNRTTYNFASVSFGTDSPDRVIAVHVCGKLASASLDINSVTIGGVSATLVAKQFYQGGAGEIAGVYYAKPSGTSGNVDVTFSTSMQDAFIAVFSMTGGVLPINYTIQTGQNPATLTVSNSTGTIITATYQGHNTTANTVSWTGATEVYEATNYDSNANYSMAYNIPLSESAISVTSSLTYVDSIGIAVSWGN
jgi:hypothetical protein